MADPRETGIRVLASFPAAVGHTHWDWSSSSPALPLRGLTRERLSALDAGPHVASSACYCPLNPFGRRSADRFTRLLPAGSGLSRQDQTNLYHGAPLRSDDTTRARRLVDASVDPTDARWRTTQFSCRGWTCSASHRGHDRPPGTSASCNPVDTLSVEWAVSLEWFIRAGDVPRELGRSPELRWIAPPGPSHHDQAMRRVRRPTTGKPGSCGEAPE